jgi:hypothetical protein
MSSQTPSEFHEAQHEIQYLVQQPQPYNPTSVFEIIYIEREDKIRTHRRRLARGRIIS